MLWENDLFVLVVDGNRVGRHFERCKFLLSVIVLRERFLSSQQTLLLLILELILLFLPRRKEKSAQGKLIRTIKKLKTVMTLECKAEENLCQRLRFFNLFFQKVFFVLVTFKSVTCTHL